ncbi:Uncharacterised protein [Vibrio cholerae]|nr:Uncharacterised protein [Vibrio cholerae]
MPKPVKVVPKIRILRGPMRSCRMPATKRQTEKAMVAIA